MQNGHDIRDMHIVQVACFERFVGEPATWSRMAGSLSLRALTHELDWVPTSGKSKRRTHSAAFRVARFLADTVFAYTISLDQDR